MNSYKFHPDEVVERIVLAQEYYNGDKPSWRYIGFSTTAGAVKHIMTQPENERCFHECLLTDAAYPLIFDYDMKGSGFTEDDYDKVFEDLKVLFSDLCSTIGISDEDIHIESACRPDKISYHIKVFGTRMYLRHQEALIEVLKTVISRGMSIDLSKFDCEIYRKHGHQNFRLAGNSKLDSQYPLRILTGRKLGDSFIHGDPVQSPGYTLVIEVNGKYYLSLEQKKTPFDKSTDENDIELPIDFSAKPKTEDDTDEVIAKIAKDKYITLGSNKFDCSIENIERMITNSFDLSTGENWRSFAKAIKCFSELEMYSDILRLFDERSKMFDGYDQGNNKLIFDRTNPFAGCLRRLIRYAADNGANILMKNTGGFRIRENELINKDQLEEIIAKHGTDNLQLLKDLPLTLYVETYGINFRVSDTEYLSYNAITGLWDHHDPQNIATQLKYFLKKTGEILGLKLGKKHAELREALKLHTSMFRYEYLIGEANPNIIPMANGLCYCAETNTIRELRYDDYITRCSNMRLESLGECSRIEAIFEDIISDDTLSLEQNNAVYSSFMAMIGYLALGDNCLQKIFVMTGHTANGKSFLAALLELALGQLFTRSSTNLVCGAKRQNESAEPERYQILSRRVALITELSSDDQWNDGSTKALSGETKLPVRNIWEEKKDVDNLCKILILTNVVPDIGVQPAMPRRFAIFNLPKRYCEPRDYEINKNYPNYRKADAYLLSRIRRDPTMVKELWNYIAKCARHYKCGAQIIPNTDVSDYCLSDDLARSLVAKLERKKGGYIGITALCENAFPNKTSFDKKDKDLVKSIMSASFSDIKFEPRTKWGAGYRGISLKPV